LKLEGGGYLGRPSQHEVRQVRERGILVVAEVQVEPLQEVRRQVTVREEQRDDPDPPAQAMGPTGLP